MSKTKLLLDECVSIDGTFNPREQNDLLRTVDLIGCGAEDEEIFDLAKKLKRTIVTRDIKFALKILLENHSVYFQKINGDRFFIQPKVEKIDNYITEFLLREETIIIP